MRMTRNRRTAAAVIVGALIGLLLAVGPTSPAGADEVDPAFPPCSADADPTSGVVTLGPDGYLISTSSAGTTCTLTACVDGALDLLGGVLDPVLGGPPTLDDLVELGVILPCDQPPPPPPEPFFGPCDTGADIAGGIVSTGPNGYALFTPWEYFETFDFSLPCTVTECILPGGSDDGMLLPCPDEPESAWQPGDGRPPWAVVGGDPASTPGRDHVASTRNPVFQPGGDSLPHTG